MADRAWRRGYQAQKRGLPCQSNPYSPRHLCRSVLRNTYYRENQAHRDWQMGWDAAERGEPDA